MNVEPDLVQAIGIAVAAIITAWTAVQGRKLAVQQGEIRELRAKMQEMDDRYGRLDGKYRSSIRTLRKWVWWDQTGRTGEVPQIPVDILDDV